MENIRDDLIQKISAYRHGDLKLGKMALWLFNCAAHPDFADLDQSDPLSRDIILALLKAHEKTARLPAPQILDDYLECLLGKKEYPPGPIEQAPVQNPFQLIRHGLRRLAFVLMRVYISVFALCSFCVNYLFFKRPDFFETSSRPLYDFVAQAEHFIPAFIYPRFYHLMTDTHFFLFLKVIRPQHAIAQIPILHLAFAFLALVPSRYLIKNIIFIIAFPLSGLGALYYWYITWDVSQKVAYIFSLNNFRACLMVAGFIAIPATLVSVRLFLLCRSGAAIRRNQYV